MRRATQLWQRCVPLAWCLGLHGHSCLCRIRGGRATSDQPHPCTKNCHLACLYVQVQAVTRRLRRRLFVEVIKARGAAGAGPSSSSSAAAAGAAGGPSHASTAGSEEGWEEGSASMQLLRQRVGLTSSHAAPDLKAAASALHFVVHAPPGAVKQALQRARAAAAAAGADAGEEEGDAGSGGSSSEEEEGGLEGVERRLRLLRWRDERRAPELLGMPWAVAGDVLELVARGQQ